VADRVFMHIRLPKEMVKELSHLAIDWETDKARAVETVIGVGLRCLRDHEQGRRLAVVQSGGRDG
jgi:hypothetical protein